MSDNLFIDICVCTYRRQSVAATLQSLAQLQLQPDWTIRVIVADNDETPSARELVEQTARTCSLNLTYIHAPARNISIARNACLDAAMAPLIAFIDDDELATPAWLGALVSTLETSKADAVLGPVQAIYSSDSPDWLRAGDFHSIKPVWVGNEIITGYTSNVLLRMSSPTMKGLRFRKELGRSGGEDTMFFASLHQAGGRIVYAPDAVVTEIVTPERAHLSWLLKRRFRSGQTHGLLLMEKIGAKPTARMREMVIAGAKMLFCGLALPLAMFDKSRQRYWLLRGAMHAGVVMRLFGQRELQQYG